MDIQDFFSLKLKIGDGILLSNDKDEKYQATYSGNLDETKGTFTFRVDSTGETKTAEINKLHTLDVTHRASS